MALPQVLIIGGGFTGLAAARSLHRAVQNGWCTVTLLDGNQNTSMIPALPDYAAGLIPREWITYPIADKLPENVTFFHARATRIDFPEKIIHTTMGDVSFDYLVIATGSSPSPPPNELSGYDTYTITNISDATDLQHAFDRHLASTPAPSIVINGAGYTGIELAICMARRAKRDAIAINIHLVEMQSRILPFLPAAQQERVMRSLARHNIQLHTESQITALQDNTLHLSNGTAITAPLICRTEGTISPLPTQDLDIPHLGDGRLEVQPTLALQRYPQVFAAGDAAAFHTPAGYLRKAVNFAYYAGAHAGNNIIRMIRNRAPRPYKPIDLGWVIPLGDDSVGKVFGNMPLSGKMGLRMHYVMCGYRNYSIHNFLRLCGHAVRAGAKGKPVKKKEQT